MYEFRENVKTNMLLVAVYLLARIAHPDWDYYPMYMIGAPLIWALVQTLRFTAIPRATQEREK